MKPNQIVAFFTPPITLLITTFFASLFVRVVVGVEPNIVLMGLLSCAAIGLLSNLILEKASSGLTFLANPALFSLAWGILFTGLLLPLVFLSKRPLTGLELPLSLVMVGLPVTLAHFVISVSVKKMGDRTSASSESPTALDS